MEVALTNPVSSNSRHVPRWPTMHCMCKGTALIAAVNHWLSSEREAVAWIENVGGERVCECVSVCAAVPSGLGGRCPSCAGSSQRPGLVGLACSRPSPCKTLSPRCGRTARRRTPCRMWKIVRVSAFVKNINMHTHTVCRTHMAVTRNRLRGAGLRFLVIYGL